MGKDSHFSYVATGDSAHVPTCTPIGEEELHAPDRGTQSEAVSSFRASSKASFGTASEGLESLRGSRAASKRDEGEFPVAFEEDVEATDAEALRHREWLAER